MVERDELERRAFAPTAPTDTNDPARFAQVTETVKDAIVLELRRFFAQTTLNTTDAARRREIPTVRKYAVGYGPGTDPYETTQQILNDWADLKERLPHAAVTAVQGRNNRLTFGQPFIGHVQMPPRVNAGADGTYALGATAYESWSVLVTSAVTGTRLAVTLNGADFAYVVQLGDTTQTAADGLRQALRAAEPLFSFERTGSTILITAGEANTAFTPAVTAGLTATQVDAAGVAETDSLSFRTLPDHRNATEETVYFRPERFVDPTAATADDIARVFNEQARYARAIVVNGRPRFLSGGKCGGRTTPNEIEILPESTDNVLDELVLGTRGVDGALTGTPPDTDMTLSSTGVGTAALAVINGGVDAYVHLAGDALAEGNIGRFKVVSAPTADSIVFENEDGVAQSFADCEWFIGLRDDWTNRARPVMNRRHLSFTFSVTVTVLAESPNEREELHDLILAQFAYFLEQQHFELLGRGWFDETFSEELWSISIAQDITTAGFGQTQRPGDQKGFVHDGRITIPLTFFDYQDRAVLVPSGPDAGESFVVTPEDITGTAESYDDFTV